MRFGVLGPLEVSEGGRRLPLRGRRLRTLLAVLLVHANEVVSADVLTSVLRSSVAPDKARHALHSQVTRLRARVEPSLHAGDRRLCWEGSGYRLRATADDLDALAFEVLSRRCHDELAAREWRAAADTAERALALWRGPALAEFSDEQFAEARAAQLEEQRQLTTEYGIDARLALGQHRALVGELEDLVARHPLREHLWGQLILALYRSGRQGDALRAYGRIRRLLAEQLGISPSAELVDLDRAVVRQDPSLTRPDAEPQPHGPAARRPAPIQAGAAPTPRPVTFLFTEVEHGTALWERDPAAMRTTLGTHDAIVQEAVDRHGGQVLTGPGDGCCVAFHRAVDAVGAALELQRRLVSEAPTGHDRPHVRIAVHTGDAEQRGGKFIGPAVNRTARLRDAAHGGQILVSAAARALVDARALDDQAELVDIGIWQFDASSQVERIYEVRHPELATGFPPLRSAHQRTGTLPRSPTSFVGRAADTQRTARALQAHPLVTISGEAGVGKSRLAVQVAMVADLADYPDGVWFCDLSEVYDDDRLVEELASTLQPTTMGSDVRAALTSSLQAARPLLVLDNCEQIRGAVAELVDEILATGAEIRILATSRAPLRAHAERVVDLGPLAVAAPGDTEAAVAPAVQLLVDRARTAGAPVAVDDPAVAEIVRLLDGLPLAIELAAPRLAAMSPTELVSRLDRRFELLTGPTSVPARQRTLKATLDWSFNLLGTEAQRLFAALSVFRGGWTLEAAELIAPTVDLDARLAASLVTELAEQSMIRVELPARGVARYRMLETVRAYAADHLVRTGRQEAVAERHALHFIALAEQAERHRRGPLEPAWVDEIEVEFDNLRAAHRWSVDTDRPADGLRLIAALVEDLSRERLELGRWAEELAALPAAVDEPLRPVALGLAGHAAMLEYRLEDALRLCLEALEVERRLSSSPSWVPRTTLALLTGLGFVEGDAREHLATMDELSRTTGDPYPAALADFDRVMILTLIGQSEKALPPAERALAVGIASRNPSLLAMGLLSHGRAVATTDAQLAAREFQDARAAAVSARHPLLAHHALRALRELDARSGDRADVLASLRRIVLTFERAGNISEQYNTLISMLDSFVALEAWTLLATICGGLSRTPWRLAPGARLIEEAIAEKLEPSAYATARRSGASMSPSDLVAHVSAFIDDLTDGEPEDR
jgi:predicted ATPase/DNA-binding SARP family transcriptional activator